jgi:hypothetical protein
MRRAGSTPLLLLASLAGLAGPFGLVACSALTAPPEPELAAAPQGTATGGGALPGPPGNADEKIGASHILVAYSGAMRAAPAVTRTKDEAKRRAQDLLQKVRAGGDFAALAKESSDDAGSGAKGGSLGTFAKGAMVKPFADAAFALKPGEVSGIDKNDFGFHIIKRTT